MGLKGDKKDKLGRKNGHRGEKPDVLGIKRTRWREKCNVISQFHRRKFAETFLVQLGKMFDVLVPDFCGNLFDEHIASFEQVAAVLQAGFLNILIDRKT